MAIFGQQTEFKPKNLIYEQFHRTHIDDFSAETSLPASWLTFGIGRSLPNTSSAESVWNGSYILPLCITGFKSVADLEAMSFAHTLPVSAKPSNKPWHHFGRFSF